MKASKFSEAQIAFVLKQAEDGTAVGEVCRKAGISEATFYNWRKRYAGLMPSEVKRLRQLEEENVKLKRLVADLSLDKAMLQREGWAINMKRTRRLYNELGLQLRNKTPKRRVKAKLREDRTDATHSNQVWAMDFVHDQLATGRKLWILAIVDTHSRYTPATDPRFSYRGEDVMQTLERVCGEVDYPKMIRVDNGSEFISRDLDLWAYQRDVILDFSRPGKPTDNAYIESFNGKSRAECLNQHWFLTLDDARMKMEEWRRDYNEVRPHSAIGNKPPISLMNASGASGPL
jgi:putative transposase